MIKLKNLLNEVQLSKYQLFATGTGGRGAGRWEFLELDNNNVLIHYLYIDPNMNIPSFILNNIMRNSAESVMEDVLNYIIKKNN